MIEMNFYSTKLNMDSKSKWTDTDKAQWILENGIKERRYIFERVGRRIYRRYSNDSLYPWENDVKREPIRLESEAHNDK